MSGRVVKDLERLAVPADDREPDPGAFGPADPVFLHRPDLFRPTLHRFERIEQIVGIAGDAEEPLRQPAPLDNRARTPALAVDHLLVGENGSVLRIPVDPEFLAVRQVLFEEIQEDALLMNVVAGMAGGDFAVPVERQPHPLQLAPHRGNIVVGPVARMDAALDRGIFRGQAEGVPSHGMDDVIPPGPAVAGHGVPQRVVADMTHVDLARRIGEHLHDIIFRLAGIGLGRETAGLVPGLLPFRLRLSETVTRHLRRNSACRPSGEPVHGCRRECCRIRCPLRRRGNARPA